MGYCSPFWLPDRFPRLTNTRVRSRVGHQHSHIRAILIRFVHYYSKFWRPRAISTIVEPRGAFMCPSSTLIVLAKSDLFRGLLLAILGPEAISIVVNPKMCLRVGHQHSQFWPILARFMDYYSPFWGPKAISMVVEFQGALTRRSSTIIVWADSGPFLRLLLYFGVLESFR